MFKVEGFGEADVYPSDEDIDRAPSAWIVSPSVKQNCFHPGMKGSNPPVPPFSR